MDRVINFYKGYFQQSLKEATAYKIDFLDNLLEKRKVYKYSCLGVALCLLHIPCKFKDSYFCSQFVSEVLSRAGAVELKKKESLYLPGQLMDEMECLFSDKQFVYNAI